jgi:hypothetical protein
MNHHEFEELIHNIDLYEQVKQKNFDIITVDEIDQMNEWSQDIERVRISGLRQSTFEYFVKTQAHNFKAILFWKNKLVENWSLLSTLPEVEFIGFLHNERISKCWNMSENHHLKGLSIEDFTRLRALDGVQHAPCLERLSFGNSVWPSVVFQDIQVLANTKLKQFSFRGKKMMELDLEIFRTMPNLERLDFPTNLLTTEEIAWLKAKIPHLEGYSIRPYLKFNSQDGMDDILICGKRKPSLHSIRDVDRIQKYEAAFWQLIERYQNQES